MKNNMQRLSILFAVLIISAMNTFASTSQNFFFFGDSLTDSGYQNNNPKVKKAGKTPIWTSPHGHTWAYYLLENYAQSHDHQVILEPNNVDAATFFHPVPAHITPILDGNNFAAGGSTTHGAGMLNTKVYKSPSLLNQTDYFVSIYAPKHTINIAKPTYFIWSGTNDLMKHLVIKIAIAEWLHKHYLGNLLSTLHLFDIKKLSAQFNETQKEIADNLLTAVTTLQKAGAKKIVVLLLPDIGDSPLMKTLAQSLQKNGITMTARQISAQMHPVTNSTNTLIRDKLKNSHVLLVDVNHLLRRITSMRTPGTFHETQQQFGKQRHFLIANNHNSACKSGQEALTCIPKVTNAQNYVFEDVAHPTDQTHQIIGDYVYYQSKQFFHW